MMQHVKRCSAVAAAGLLAVAMTVPAQQETPLPSTTAPKPQLAPDMSPTARGWMEQHIDDWAQLKHYAAANAKLQPPAAGEKRVVFYGDSLTDNWGHSPEKFFPGKPYVNRGISGQTSGEMVVRFRQDVINLHPAAVVILAGTNDIGGNTGPVTLEQIEDNLSSMVDMARANRIRVVLSSVLPASYFPWRTDIAPAESIRALNTWIKSYCDREHLVYLNYYDSMVNADGGMKPELAADKFVHPNAAGYAVMQPLAQAAVDKVLSSK